MLLNQILNWIMGICALLGALDLVIGDKYGLGTQFKKGYETMGSLALSMVGMICLAPWLASIISPLVTPVFNFLRMDPALTASILAIDMGGYPLASELGQSQAGVYFSGIILASMFGCTLVFTLPISFNLIEVDHHQDLARGLMAGLVAVPIGAGVGGLVARISLAWISWNLFPILILSVLLIIGLWKYQAQAVKIIIWFARGLNAIIYLGLAIAAFEALTGRALVDGLAPIEEGLAVVASIATTLLGAYPMVYLLTRLLKRPLACVGALLGIDAQASGGLLVTLANSVPVYAMTQEMSPRGRIMNVAFIVPATSLLGAHLAYTSSVASEMVSAMLLAKMSGGIVALILAYLLCRDLPRDRELTDA